MKVKRKEFEKDGKGLVMLIAEESEDLWHLHNIVAAGDQVKALTYRKVMREDGKGSDTKKLRLCIEVKNVEYDAGGDALRFSGTVCEESEWVKMGAHHTIQIELNEPITITKDCWDGIYEQQLEDATDISRSAEVAVCLIEAKDAGKANLSLLTNVLAKRVGQVEHSLPKAKITSTNVDKAMEKFFIKLYGLVKDKIKLDMVKCVVLGGPGDTKRTFKQWMEKHAMQQGDSEIDKKKGIFLCIDTTSIHNQGLQEILEDEQVQKRVANTRAAMHLKALQEFEKRNANEPERVCYGPKEVRKAFEMGAVDTMMISDALFRNTSIQVRREYVNLVAEVKDRGAAAYVFSSGHVTGQKLKEYADIAALLRFQVEFEEIEPDIQNEPQPVKQEIEPDQKNASQPVKPEPDQKNESQPVKKEPEPAKKVAFVAGDTVEPLEEFASNSKNVVQLPKGKQGKVIKIDDVGDAYIDFGDLGKQCVKPKSFHLLKVAASFRPPTRPPADKAKPNTTPKPKPTPKKEKPKAKLQMDDYDRW